MLYRDANPRPRGNISGVGRLVVSSPGEKWTVKILLAKLCTNDLRDVFSSWNGRGDSVARGKGVLMQRERETLHGARLACLIYSLTYLDFGDRLGIPVLIYSD